MPEVRPLGLDGVLEIIPKKFADARGFFSETYSAREFADAGIGFTFVQDNHSYSAARGVLRGLHFQLPPFAQDKLVRVVCGSIFDVVVDIRKGSPTFGHWVGIPISAEQWNQVLIPKGYAHGFVTLEPETEVLYKVTAPYTPSYERVIRFDDPEIGIHWPVPAHEIQLSNKDRNVPALVEIETGFEHQ